MTRRGGWVVGAAAVVATAGRPAAAGPNLCLVAVEDAMEMPLVAGGLACDSSSPAEWIDGEYRLWNSALNPVLAVGADMADVMNDPGAWAPVEVVNDVPHRDRWLESTYYDAATRRLYGWYHHEQDRDTYGCGYSPWSGSLTFPDIGAMVSTDGGEQWTDLGIVLRANPATEDCAALNGDFSGGHGDPSVIVQGAYVYFYFNNYGGPAATQGVTAARMAKSQLAAPVGKVFKWQDGGFTAPGLGGGVSPIGPAFQATVGYQSAAVDALWGPNIHYNTHLQRWVMLLNRTLPNGSGMYGQEGLYVAFNANVANPAGWTAPRKMNLPGAGWYPQVLGYSWGDTDKRAGQFARFFTSGSSGTAVQFFDDQLGVPAGCIPYAGSQLGRLLP
jgi:hypothetical protein